MKLKYEIQYFEINGHVVADSTPLESECKGSKPINKFTGCLKSEEYDFFRWLIASKMKEARPETY